jgi:hypothetical protein
VEASRKEAPGGAGALVWGDDFGEPAAGLDLLPPPDAYRGGLSGLEAALGAEAGRSFHSGAHGQVADGWVRATLVLALLGMFGLPAGFHQKG